MTAGPYRTPPPCTRPECDDVLHDLAAAWRANDGLRAELRKTEHYLGHAVVALLVIIAAAVFGLAVAQPWRPSPPAWVRSQGFCVDVP